MRIGLGYDSHKLVSGRKLILGGVTIPNDKGLLGHSDADVLIHAIIDAMFGAAAMGDIGTHYPDNDERYRDISGLTLLLDSYNIIKAAGYRIINMDSVILCEKPKLMPYIPNMKNIISGILETDENAIGIKAKTNEGMGAIGNGEMIACMVSVLLE